MEPKQILLLEDNADDALLLKGELSRTHLPLHVVVASSKDEFLAALEKGGFELVLSDNAVAGFSGLAALELVKLKRPSVPFVFVSGHSEPDDVKRGLEAGAVDFLAKDQLWRLGALAKRVLAQSEQKIKREARVRAMQRLVAVVQELSFARSIDAVAAVVRRAARELTGADGATFVLREGDCCHYADEDAIAPLWKGRRFPMSTCISGWVMLNREPALIEDIYADPRIPADAYRPTFVKSLAMVPIRTKSPIGAIGNYWAHPHLPSAEELELLQALANTTSVAMENVQLFSELEQRVKERTAQLELANRELEAFSYSVSHDLRAPVRAIEGFSQLLLDETVQPLPPQAKDHLDRIANSAKRMKSLIDDLLHLSKVARMEIRRDRVNLSGIASEITDRLQAESPGRPAEIRIAPDLSATGDPGLLRVALENLLSNAWKYSSRALQTVIEFGAVEPARKPPVFFVRDNGAGFDMNYAGKLFAPFQRLHRADEFPGTGIGLATVQRIVHKHGGTIWAEAAPGRGATFFFTLPAG